MKIEQIDVRVLRYPTLGYFKFFRPPGKHTVILVKITADNGTIGWGQSIPVPTWSYESPETALTALEEHYVPALLGHDPRDIEGAHRIMDQALSPSFSTGMPLTRAGIDIALHDLAGKLAGQSVAELWGRPRGGPVALSWTINVTSLEQAEQQVEEGLRRGYRSFNIKVAPDPRFDVLLIRRVRQLAPNAFIWADANGGYDPATALEAAGQLADAGIEALESPLKPNQIRGYQALKKQGAVPITMDEGVVSPVEAEEFIHLGMVDGLTIKISRAGGLLSARRQIERVVEAGLFWLGSGLTDPDVSLAASLALFSAYGLEKPAALVGPQFLTDDILVKPLTIHHGVAEVPTGPGLGITVNEAKLAALE